MAGGNVRRGKRKRVDYLLSYLRDRPLAVVEAKSEYRIPAAGLQQAKEYAQMLDLKFAYSTNGPGIVEHDFTTGLDNELAAYPSPDELWRRDCARAGSRSRRSSAPCSVLPRGRARAALLPGHLDPPRDRGNPQGRARVLLTLATGTGKTVVAFQICWSCGPPAGIARASSANRASSISPTATCSSTTPRTRPSRPFGDARHKIEAATPARAARCTSPRTRPSRTTKSARPVSRVPARLL